MQLKPTRLNDERPMPATHRYFPTMRAFETETAGKRGLRHIVMIIASAAFFGLVSVASAEAEEHDDLFHLGLIEYEISCLPCHGIDGRGDGPDANNLATRPSDLTEITKSKGGVFPTEDLALIIDGRAIVADHGAREMPVWGQRYRRKISDDGSEWDIEEGARSRIDALVWYIESIQQQ